MNIIKLFFLFNFVFSNEIIKPKLCINCVFFHKNFLSSNKFGKCSFYPIPKYNDYFLVDGKTEVKKEDNHYCSTARNYENMCGKDGKHFIKKKKKRFF